MRQDTYILDCKLFCDGTKCPSKKAYDKCNGLFYQCSLLNNESSYEFAIKHFNEIKGKQNVSYDAKTGSFKNSRKTCDPRLREDIPNLKNIPTKTERKTHNIVENNDEDFICKCLYHCYAGECPHKDMCNRYFEAPVNVDYKIVYYQVTPKLGNCGKVDLLIKNTNEEKAELFLTEVKPPVGNEESLLRMLAEITYHSSRLINNVDYRNHCKKEYLGNQVDINKITLLPAIMFFNGSEQEKEYSNISDGIKNIIDEYKVVVFCCDKDTKIITRLN